MVLLWKCGWVPLPKANCHSNCRNVNPLSRPTMESVSTVQDDRWVNTTCPHCGNPAPMKPILCHSGRFLLVLPALLRSAQRWVSGIQRSTGLLVPGWLVQSAVWNRTTLHLLYSRFWHKFPVWSQVVSNRNHTQNVPAMAWFWVKTREDELNPAAAL